MLCWSRCSFCHQRIENESNRYIRLYRHFGPDDVSISHVFQFIYQVIRIWCWVITYTSNLFLFLTLTNSMWIKCARSGSHFLIDSISNKTDESLPVVSVRKKIYLIILFVLWYIYDLDSKKKAVICWVGELKQWKSFFLWRHMTSIRIRLLIYASNISLVLCIDKIAI